MSSLRLRRAFLRRAAAAGTRRDGGGLLRLRRRRAAPPAPLAAAACSRLGAPFSSSSSSSAAAADAPPAPPPQTPQPPPARTILPDRALLHVHGREAAKFLQGLVTNDVLALSAPGAALYTHLLNAKGRALFEAFVARPNEGSPFAADADADADPDAGSFLLDCHVDVVPRMTRNLKMHKLRAKVKIRNLAETHEVRWESSSSGHDDDDTADTASSAPAAVECSFVDPRAPTLGRRTFAVKRDLDDVGGGGGGGPDVDVVNVDAVAAYDTLRVLHGALEGTEVDGAIPLECNLDLLNGVVFDKGCYLGQELTARTHFRGLLRKRCFPVIFGGAPVTARGTSALTLTHAEAHDVALRADGGALATELGVRMLAAAAAGDEAGEEGTTDTAAAAEPLAAAERGTQVTEAGKGKRAGKLLSVPAAGGPNVGVALLRLEHVVGDLLEGGGEAGADTPPGLPERSLLTKGDAPSTVRPIVLADQFPVR